jgi:hypothetical protein
VDKKNPEHEYANYYRPGVLKFIERNSEILETVCPWVGQLPEMEVYEYRGARMLSNSLWKGKCFTCYFATMYNVEIQWDFDRDIKQYRFNRFATVLNPANITNLVERERFHTGGEILLLIPVGWMTKIA